MTLNCVSLELLYDKIVFLFASFPFCKINKKLNASLQEYPLQQTL